MARRALLVGLAVIGASVAVAGLVLLLLRPPAPSPVARDPWTVSTTIHSALLAREMPIEVFVPPDENTGRLPVLFLFHGRGADQMQWISGVSGDGVGIDSIAHSLIDAGSIKRLAIVSAFIDDSYGVDSAAGSDGYAHGPYERYIVEELIPQVEQRFQIGGVRSLRAVGGLSMGGFAALNSAFRHPDEFSGVGALSPAFFVHPPTDRAWIYSGPDRQDVMTMAEGGSATGMNIFLGDGAADYQWIRGATSALATELNGRSASLSAITVPGGHEIATWRRLAKPMLLALFGS